MAFLTKKSFYSLVLPLCLLLFFSIFPSTRSLSTVAISENSNQTIVCALTQSSSDQQYSYLNCTSFPRRIQIPLTPLNSFISGIVAGNGFLCALRSQPSSSIIGCWRFSTTAFPEQDWSYKRIYRGLPINDLSAGNSHICGITRGGLECWQWTEFNSTTIDFQDFTSVAVGEDFVCGLSEYGNIKCNNTTVSGYEPSGYYSVLAAGFRHACAISVNNGSLECWGDMAGVNPPEGEFTKLALGENRSCAMRPNGTVACWGENHFVLPERLSSTFFVAIEAKRNIFCGITLSDFSLLCWGNEIFENSNSTVLENVVPGPCQSACPCSGPLPGYGSYCSQGLMICEPCVSNSPTAVVILLPPPAQQETTTRGGGGWNKKMVAFLVVGCVGSVSLLAVCCFLFFQFCNVRGCRVHDSGPLDVEANIPPQPTPAAAVAPVLEKRLSHLVSVGNGGHLEEFPLHLLLKATNNFSDDHKIGLGSFGSVYHAVLDDGHEVAIKRAETMAGTFTHRGGATKRQQDDKDNAFVNELEFLSRLNHKNLVKLLGYCEESGELILVYEYMKYGTLHDHLHNLEDSPLMSWPARIKVALDAARGIEYLHVYAVPQIIHCDIKSSNILLDDVWTAKVSDFGLSMMGPSGEESHLSLRAAGTVGYMDPEYYRLQQLTPKSDVYSFGVVMLEMLSGHKAIHRNENGMPRNVVDFVAPYIVQDEIHRVLDPKVAPPTPFEIEAVAYVGYIAVDCVMPEGRHRPTITEIVNSLERALAACYPHSPPLSRSTTGSSA